jgi:hypothetical protein
MYHSLVLSIGLKVRIYSLRLNSVALRYNAFVIYYADILANSFIAMRPLSFSTVVTLFSNPANLLL